MHYGTVTHASVGLGELQRDAIRKIWAVITRKKGGRKDIFLNDP